jgi:hypothetical protein
LDDYRYRGNDEMATGSGVSGWFSAKGRRPGG